MEASGASDMDGNAARWRRASREKSESICLEMRRLSARNRGMERAGRPRHRWSNPRRVAGETDGRAVNQTAYWLDLLAEADLGAPERLQPIRQECGELIAILVTILKRSKESIS